jgi:23S rRNA (cytidine2498-2'-O)-methyltransferase
LSVYLQNKNMNVFVAREGFEKELQTEIKNFKAFENFYLSKESSEAIWAQDVWYDAQEIEFESIGDAAKKLKTIFSHWVGFSVTAHRRCQLIQEQLNFYKKPALDFLGELPKQKFGRFLLIDKNKLLAAKEARHPLPLAIVDMKENKDLPPSRAYLKLWELFTVYGIKPTKQETVLDLGACPGGWSWVLSQVSGKVIAVDKAPLDEKISKIKNIRYLKKDAFELKPEEVGKVDWLFSDIICEPKRLLELIEKWKNAGVGQFVCTLKFKGNTDFKIIEKFAAIKGAKLYHLYHNKHELTLVLKNS